MKSRKRSIKMARLKVAAIVMACVISLAIISIMTIVLIDKTTNEISVADEVPVMNIKLDGVTLDEVHENEKDVEYENSVVELNEDVFYNVEFKGRGNFSWVADKKSYRIKFAKKTDLLSLGRVKKWALIANSVDNSLMRNDLAQYLMEMVTGKGSWRGDFVELIINGEDLGLYYLTKTMDIGKQVVDLRDPMGVLVELDNAYCQSEDKRYETTKGNCIALKDAVADDNADAAMLDFAEDFNELENAVAEGDYNLVTKLADVKSLAEYFVISEFAANPDAYVTSWYFYKDGFGDKIHTGLVWDFDAAFGNRQWGNESEEFYAPTTTMARMKYSEKLVDEAKEGADWSKIKVSSMMRGLLKMPEFLDLVKEIYTEKLMKREDEIMNYIDSTAMKIRESAVRDNTKWDKGDFDKEVEYLKWWIGERMVFFEKNYAKHLIKLEDKNIAV